MKISAAIRRSFLFVLLAVAGIFVWSLCAFFGPFEPRLPEPQFQGKKLTDWAQDVFPSNYLASVSNPVLRAKSDRAVAAIRQIGTNALPMALQLCGTRDSWFKLQLVEVTSYNSDGVLKYRITPEWEKHDTGNNIILALGLVAAPAIPALIQLLQSSDTGIADSVMVSLPNIGTNVIPPLSGLLGSTNEIVRIRAAIILGRNFSAWARAAIPALIQGAENREVNLITRLGAIHCLGLMREDTADVLPILIRQVQTETNAIILRSYFDALGNLGTNAGPAVPLLVHILESNPPEFHSSTKEQALGNLMKIDPDTAKPFVQKWKATTDR